MTVYKINIDDRHYNSWTIYDSSTLQSVHLDINPNEQKLLTGDVFTFDNNKLEIIHSSVRMTDNIPAVLVLEDNKTYGRQIKLNTNGIKKGKMLYKCIPDDKRIPIFLVAYELKHMGFSKVFSNLYVTISFDEWTDKHPIAKLSNVIGEVNILDNFYEYQLYCKSLNASIQKFTKDTSKAIKEKTCTHDSFIENICKSNTQIQNRLDQKEWQIFTIDPAKSSDFDDAFSIKTLHDGSTLLSIYIANVTIWMDSLNLWDSFSRRIATIYLPDRKRPMLPTILSDCLCSLQANASRIAFVMDITINHGVIVDIQYLNCVIRVYRNYVYQEPDLLNNDNYNNIFKIAKELSNTYKYIHSIRTSHDLVSYLMILMNYYCAKEMLKNNNGIFKSILIKKHVELPQDLPEEVSKFIKIWNSGCGQYINLNTNNIDVGIRHELLEMDAYIHITSPIRRLVDLLNIIKLQTNLSIIKLSDNAFRFYDKWVSELDYINITMRAIRKVQSDCNLLNVCVNSPEILDKLYEGYCFDKLEREDGLYQYIVFLPKLRLTSRITLRDNLDNYQKRQYKLYLFNDEEKFKKKIRLQLI